MDDSEYPRELIARVAAVLLANERTKSDPLKFARAARRACKLLDACEEAAARHHRERYGLDAPLDKGRRVRFREALRRIDKKFRTLPASRTLYRQFVFDQWADTDGLDLLDAREKAALWKTVDERIKREESTGILDGAIEPLRVAFEDWRKKKAIAAHRASGKKSATVRAERATSTHMTNAAKAPQRRRRKKTKK